MKAGDAYLNGEPSARNLWKLGFLTTDDVFIGLSQGDLQPQTFVADETRKGVADGQSVVGDADVGAPGQPGRAYAVAGRVDRRRSPRSSAATCPYEAPRHLRRDPLQLRD